MSYQRTAVPLKNQTRKILSEAQIRQGIGLLQKANVWLHVILIYGEHVSPVVLITHTRWGKDPADIPKESEDPTTSRVRERKISRDTSHALQELTRFWG